ncbi:DUF6359 domain-containing protein [Agaribacterium haliotis]|uniref:DUF6359 domain-containing protein n=1 Tax=Agaribacterium haliotis TaxID=2013869 RepID=UPI000BB52D4F|nr:DUF6359 domain-containing protein [Agaribacterium haliotis]
MLKNKWSLALSLCSICALSHSASGADYQWNYPAPVKTPSATSNNGKIVLFDVSHGGVEGNADWVIDGAFSDFADALVNEGYRVEEYRGVDKNGDGLIQFVDDYNNPSASNSALNEAQINFQAISHADVLVLAESNRPFTLAEQTALEQFVAAGKGIYFIGDHYNADRNLNSWDSTEVFNGYNRSDLSQFNVGGVYGDLRHPGAAGGGWLAQNFGIRFRFNAIDYIPGASLLVDAQQSEGITVGAGPVLMAGGATLAITDASRAKGLVYFAPGDSPSAWNHAVDSGLYLGGSDEGPYVAIAKSGAGKAAFIGDSSPIEDASPKYRREDNGNTKRTYPGWTDAGNAAQLSINIVNWLATPESYTHFNSSAHPPGFVTPQALFVEELSDPDNGQPWNTPSGGYQPWDKSTFAYGSYGAPQGPGGSSGGGDPSSDALSVGEALALGNGSAVTVRGVVTQAINGEYALEIADATNSSNKIFIKLESQYRAEFSPQNNPAIIGRSIEVSGVRDDYMSSPSVESVSAMILVSDNSSGSPSALSVGEALNQTNGSDVSVIGEISQAINGEYALELSDLNNPSQSIYVKLDAAYRAEFSPQNQPQLIGQQLQVSGRRDDYMNYPSIEYVTAMQLVGSPGGSGNAPCSVPGAVSVATVKAADVGTAFTTVGLVVAGVNDPYALELADINDSTSSIYVKLESHQRSDFSPALNPSVLGTYLEVSGRRDLYISYPSLESVSHLQISTSCP